MKVSITYEAWNMEPAAMPPRSRLYALKPVGIGTPYVESLISYIARLAEAHCVSIGSLFTHELEPMFKRLLAPKQIEDSGPKKRKDAFIYLTDILNGTSPHAEFWIQALEYLTRRPNVCFLTLLPLRNLVLVKDLLRRHRVWCMSCYQARRQTKRVVYDHLLWAVQGVEVCPYHRSRLSSFCPHCEQRLPLLDHKLRVGHCSLCLRWLGAPQMEEQVDINVNDPIQLGDQIRLASHMGGLLAALPSLESRTLKA